MVCRPATVRQSPPALSFGASTLMDLATPSSQWLMHCVTSTGWSETTPRASSAQSNGGPARMQCESRALKDGVHWSVVLQAI